MRALAAEVGATTINDRQLIFLLLLLFAVAAKYSFQKSSFCSEFS
jgi:hypothetical protein